MKYALPLAQMALAVVLLWWSSVWLGHAPPPHGYARTGSSLHAFGGHKYSCYRSAKIIMGTLCNRAMGQRNVSRRNRPVVVLDSVEYRFLAKAALDCLARMAPSANSGRRGGGHCARWFQIIRSIISYHHSEYFLVSARLAMVSSNMGGFVLLDCWNDVHFRLRPHSVLPPQATDLERVLTPQLFNVKT